MLLVTFTARFYGFAQIAGAVLAISAATLAPSDMITAVPRRSLNVTPTMPTFADALRHEARIARDLGLP